MKEQAKSGQPKLGKDKVFKEASPARGWESARRGRNVSSVLDERLAALEIIGQANLPCVGA